MEFRPGTFGIARAQFQAMEAAVNLPAQAHWPAESSSDDAPAAGGQRRAGAAVLSGRHARQTQYADRAPRPRHWQTAG